MKKAIVTEYIVGKILAEDIYNKQNVLLLKAGNRVTPVVVNRLKVNNVVSVWIK
ncbi:hypothetical protein WMW72_20580 [Paenibacillus filicis]|uniref:Uncharacterized protein n=1 Tax=Paenibacillus filicis TaxID=669464 RepID=A0ABU9DQE6_9BACL